MNWFRTSGRGVVALALMLGWAVLGPGAGSSRAWTDEERPELLPADRDGYGLELLANDPETEIVLRLTIEGLAIRPIELAGERFSLVELAGAGTTLQAGEPQLPLVSRLVAISAARDPVADVAELRTRTVFLDDPVLPCQQAEIEDLVEIAAWDRELYAAAGALPRQPLRCGPPELLRDLRVCQLSYSPVRYYPAERRLEIVEEAEIRIVPGAPSTANLLDPAPAPLSPTWDGLYRAAVANYAPPAIDRGEREHYLLAVRSDHTARFADWIDWKSEEGFIVDLVEFSESTTAAEIRDQLIAAYSGPDRPTFVLLAGDETVLPVRSSSFNYTWNGQPYSGSYVDDSYYSRLYGTDYLPDVFLGRLPFPEDNPDHLDTMLQRVLYWERTPNLACDYYSTALMACSNLYASQRTTKEQVAERLRRMHHFTTVHEEYDWEWNTAMNVMNDINDGVALINYRGEGWHDGWNPGHVYTFYTGEVASLQNHDRPTVITSIGCGVGMFAAPEGPDFRCFGEAWLQLGGPGDVRGAVTLLGPTWNTHTTFNNWMDRGMYRGLAYDDLSVMSPAYLAGKIYMRDHLADYPVIIEMEFNEFLQLGTPDTRWRTVFPRPPVWGLAYAPTNMKPYLAVRTAENWMAVGARAVLEPAGSDPIHVMLGSDGAAFLSLPEGTANIPLRMAGYNMVPFASELRFEGDTGRLVITEVKPDIETDGQQGDMLEIANFDTRPIELRGLIATDLDLYDLPFVSESVVLHPGKLAVIHFVGGRGEEEIVFTDYGVEIWSRAYPDFDSSEDQCVLRDSAGRILDGLAWHGGDGLPATRDNYRDLSRFTPPTSRIEVTSEGWWDAADDVSADEYDASAVDWSAFAGPFGPGSIQRLVCGGLDGPASFAALATESWGETDVVPATPTPGPTPTPPASAIDLELTLPAAVFQPGMTFALDLSAGCVGPNRMVEQYLVLDIWGAYWFWPSWGTAPDSAAVLYHGGDTVTWRLLEFAWPEGAGAAQGITFWAAALDFASGALASDVASVEFDFTD